MRRMTGGRRLVVWMLGRMPRRMPGRVARLRCRRRGRRPRRPRAGLLDVHGVLLGRCRRYLELVGAPAGAAASDASTRPASISASAARTARGALRAGRRGAAGAGAACERILFDAGDVRLQGRIALVLHQAHPHRHLSRIILGRVHVLARDLLQDRDVQRVRHQHQLIRRHPELHSEPCGGPDAAGLLESLTDPYGQPADPFQTDVRRLIAGVRPPVPRRRAGPRGPASSVIFGVGDAEWHLPRADAGGQRGADALQQATSLCNSARIAGDGDHALALQLAHCTPRLAGRAAKNVRSARQGAVMPRGRGLHPWRRRARQRRQSRDLRLREARRASDDLQASF
mmetsp:Transcript_1380/g.2899  ORF Transcript_1380/g.2899 Transcript_1380/m.2899 type:complete len:342 (-) Transcript_1380:175-1200(-)